MPHARSILLSDAQVALIHARRLALGYSLATFLDRVEAALDRDGSRQSRPAAKMRVARALSERMRCYTSEATLLAIAAALGWTWLELAKALGLPSEAARVKSRRARNGRGQGKAGAADGSTPANNVHKE